MSPVMLLQTQKIRLIVEKNLYKIHTRFYRNRLGGPSL